MTPPQPARIPKPADRVSPPVEHGAAVAADSSTAKLKLERDRYVAFAFAAGDVLLEIGPDRHIRMASGACQGRPSQGRPILEGQPAGRTASGTPAHSRRGTRIRQPVAPL